MSKWQAVVIIVAICGILVSGIMLIKTFAEYKTATDEYETLNQYTASASDTAVSGFTPVMPVTESDEPVKVLKRNNNREDFPDLEVDFAGLMGKNKDVVAWLYVGAVGISYPVVQGEDNEYYLHHTLEDTKNSSGSIFMDWEVHRDLTSWNTFFYGHNMKNGSMFGSLKKFIREEGTYDKDPYIYVFIPGYIYRYKIFSYYLDSPDSKMYWTCDSLKEYRQYIRDALEKSVDDCNTPTTEEENMITLVTCSGSGASKQRFFVHGEFIDRYVYEVTETQSEETDNIE